MPDMSWDAYFPFGYLEWRITADCDWQASRFRWDDFCRRESTVKRPMARQFPRYRLG